MLESMEGRRAMPRLKPPFPSQVGYLGRPTLIQNVETLAHILAIGGEWWAGLGTRGASGTRLWSVTGAVARPGCYEAPSGVTTRELVDEHAGGFTDDVGAVVPGGAASGILPPAALDAPLTRDRLREYGAGPGSAAVQVFPRSSPAPVAGGDDALLRGGVVPEVHAVPHRESRAAPRVRGARARRGSDDAREGRRMVARDGEDVDLRPRAGVAVSRAERDALVARALRPAQSELSPRCRSALGVRHRRTNFLPRPCRGTEPWPFRTRPRSMRAEP